MNHDRVNINQSPISCGVLGINRISSDIKDVLYAIATHLYHPSRGAPAAFIIASDLYGEKTSTSALMNEVDRSSFGEITSSSPEDNPKTGNTIVVYTWKINHTSFKEWYSKQRVERLAKVGA